MYLQLQCLDTQNFWPSMSQSRAIISSTARKKPNRIFILVEMQWKNGGGWSFMQMQISQHGERKSTSQFVSDLDAPHFAINSDAEDKSSALSFAFKVLPYGQQHGNISGRYNTDISVYICISLVYSYTSSIHTPPTEKRGNGETCPGIRRLLKNLNTPRIYTQMFSNALFQFSNMPAPGC